MKSNGFYILQISLVAALGGFLFGFDTAVISGTTEKLKDLFALSDGGLGFTVASALIGTIIGVLMIGVINNGMNLLNVPPFWQNFIKGAVIFIAVMIDSLKNRPTEG